MSPERPVARCCARPHGALYVACLNQPGHTGDHFWQSLDIGVRWRWPLTNAEQRARKRDRHAA